MDNTHNEEDMNKLIIVVIFLLVFVVFLYGLVPLI
jgi:preprotein translocase subunit SecE